jgi:hypothetical protein
MTIRSQASDLTNSSVESDADEGGLGEVQLLGDGLEECIVGVGVTQCYCCWISAERVTGECIDEVDRGDRGHAKILGAFVVVGWIAGARAP